MSSSALLAVGLIGALGLVIALVVAVVVKLASLKSRFRASCTSLGLTRTSSAWVGTLDGVPVGVAWVRYFVYVGGSAQTEWRTSYTAKISPPLGLGLLAYGNAKGVHSLRPTLVQTWELVDKPVHGFMGSRDPGIALGDPYLDGRMYSNARDPERARAALVRAAAEIGTILRSGADLRIADDGVEILGEAYDNRLQDIQYGLQNAALLAAVLGRARPH